MKSALDRIEPVVLGQLSGRDTTRPLAPYHQFDVRNPNRHHYNTNFADELVFEFSGAGLIAGLFSGSWRHVVLADTCPG